VGLDIHIHDTYFAVGHIPMAVAIFVLGLAVLFGAWKLLKFVWLMLAS
jgi:hypothetical protein